MWRLTRWQKKLSNQTVKFIQTQKDLAECRRQLERLSEERDRMQMKIRLDEVKFIKEKVGVDNELKKAISKITYTTKEKVKLRLVNGHEHEQELKHDIDPMRQQYQMKTA